MRRFFDMDNPVMRALSTAADLLALNILVMLCSLPLFTMGAAFTAMNDVVLRQVRGEEGYLFRGYLRAFRSNFKKAAVLGLIVLGALLLTVADYIAAGMFIPVLRIPVVAVGVLVIAWAKYAFALQCRYENTIGTTIKNAAALMVGYFPRTLGMAVFSGGFWLLAIKFWRIGAPLLIIFGFSLPCYVGLLLMLPIFDKLEGKSPSDEDEPDDMDAPEEG